MRHESTEAPESPSELAVLREQNRQLRAELERLQARLKDFELHPDAAGTNAEAYVVGLVRGVFARDGRCDVIARNGRLLEVKFSRAHYPKRARKTRTTGTCLWAWSKVLGSRQYDHLILVGNANTPYGSAYRLEPSEQFVLFDIPYSEVRGLVTKQGKHLRIILNANPASARGVARVLFDKYRVSAGDLEKRYGRSASE